MLTIATPETHRIVSELVTPQHYISNKDPYGNDSKYDYPEFLYMRYIANKYYPGWSIIMNHVQPVNIENKPAFILEACTITWQELIKTGLGDPEYQIVTRSGRYSAAHRSSAIGIPPPPACWSTRHK